MCTYDWCDDYNACTEDLVLTKPEKLKIVLPFLKTEIPTKSQEAESRQKTVNKMKKTMMIIMAVRKIAVILLVVIVFTL